MPRPMAFNCLRKCCETGERGSVQARSSHQKEQRQTAFKERKSSAAAEKGNADQSVDPAIIPLTKCRWK